MPDSNKLPTLTDSYTEQKMRVGVNGSTVALLQSFCYIVLFIPCIAAFSVCPTSELRRVSTGPTTELMSQRTLASDYVIDVSESHWKAHRIDRVVSEASPEGEMAVMSLSSDLSDMVDEPCFTLSVTLESDTAKIRLKGRTAQDVDESLIAILSRVMVQWAIERQGSSAKTMAIQLLNEKPISNISLQGVDGVLELFKPLIDTIEPVELSEMVDQNGKSLGIVPRKLVHKVNLLHRGVGMVVTKDQPILVPGCTDFPDLYMHRRTDTKRIFPSLYDMFVGGVSTAREESKTTAAREVAEELGLVRALTDPTMLSDPLFECIVCTAYNRCVVTVFCCTFDSTKDSVQWQEEEVAWGDFVPYDTIVASADLSIQRLIENRSWPASVPVNLKHRFSNSQKYIGTDSAWKNWDYVPDGLLVWEAWLQWQANLV